MSQNNLKPKSNPASRRRFWTGMAFISPWVIGFLVFTLYPLLASLYFSFCDYDVMSEPVNVGLLNYKEMIADEIFWLSLWNTLKYAAVAIPLSLVTALVFAALLNQQIVARPAFRTIFFLPTLVPVVASAMIWLWIFNGKFGLLNYGLSQLGIEGPQWLRDPDWTVPSLVIMSVWGIGNSIVIYLAALQDVPRHLYESASIDGANSIQKFFHVTIPMISPVIYFNLIMGIISSLQVFIQPFIMMPRGGPDRSALFFSVYLYENAFSYLNMGYACAMAWVMFLLIMLLTWLATRSTRSLIHHGG